MGREIVRQESTIEPGKRSRLWFDEDIVHVLEENTGTDKIEVIKLEGCNSKEVQLSGETFKKMKNLRILIIGDAIFSTQPQHLPNSLRVLDWSYYPSPSLPSTFNPKKLMTLKLAKSCFQFFQPLKRLESLWSINFEGCKFLIELPSLCEVPLLRHLCIDNCTKLVRIDESVGFLDHLSYLSAKNCTHLESLVPCINLRSLEVLNLTECIRLKRFPEVSGKMHKIREIYLDYTGIIELPFSIENLIGLECLYLRGCRSLNQLPHSVRTLPKVEVIMGYGWIYSERFKLFEGEEKVISKSQVSPGAMMIMDDKGTCVTTCLDVYYEYISPNNVLQLCAPNLHERPSFELLFKKLDQRQCLIKDLSIMASMESSTRFWFRNKFPKITLCCSEHHAGYLMYFKFKVIINDSEQFGSSCISITQRQQNSWRQQVLVCDIECKEKAMVFSEHEWNEVKITCQVEFPRAELSHSEMYMPSTPSRHGFIKWTHIYVDKELNIMDDIKFYYPWRNEAHSYYFSLPRWMRMGDAEEHDS
ncbi:hypothetical protein RIF29_06256 [Crotalaria pallida]|uniref:Disease resistance protein RPS4B/Roq1-like leucine-rich repeats domain-containing protein n=1 Tax=Crotalaria pallida TaxID=3830 RepID=A0AAN9PAT1_CROPI